MSEINKINKNKKNTRIIFRICIIFLILSSVVFLFYIIDGKNVALNITKYKDLEKNKSSKLMTNPKISFEYKNGNWYDIKGKTAQYKKNGDITVKQVVTISNSGNIKSYRLDITDNGNVIIFNGKPELEFYNNIINRK